VEVDHDVAAEDDFEDPILVRGIEEVHLFKRNAGLQVGFDAALARGTAEPSLKVLADQIAREFGESFIGVDAGGGLFKGTARDVGGPNAPILTLG